jgi:hypothetical protein
VCILRAWPQHLVGLQHAAAAALVAALSSTPHWTLQGS